MEDRRAHERIDSLANVVDKHIKEHTEFETSLKSIETNTAEIVELIRGAKGIRHLVVWAAPIVTSLIALYAWVKSQ